MLKKSRTFVVPSRIQTHMLKKVVFTSWLTVLLHCLLVTQLHGQPVTLSREFGANLGFSSFLGDLGGSNDIGRPFFWDIDPEITRPAIGFVFRQEIIPRTAFRFNAYASMLRANDALTQNEWRNWRNMSMRTPIVEASAMLELSLNRFTGMKKKRWTPYIYGGVGAFYFNPQAKYNNEWVDLQPLGTEGQGLPEYPDRKKYSRIAVCFPLGAGFRILTYNNWVMRFEMASRFTTTDYIDDVSTYYPNPDYYFLHYELEQAIMAAALSNPSVTPVPVDHPLWGTPETLKGDPTNNDSYIFGGMLTFTYHIEFKRKVNNIRCYFDEDNKR